MTIFGFVLCSSSLLAGTHLDIKETSCFSARHSASLPAESDLQVKMAMHPMGQVVVNWKKMDREKEEKRERERIEREAEERKLELQKKFDIKYYYRRGWCPRIDKG